MVQKDTIKPKIIVIAGPTASGKSSIGIECAKIFNGEIISADSMQIYKKLDIGTAKITKSEMQGIKHHMLDIVEPGSDFSVSDFCEQAKSKIDAIHKKGKIPIIVGGTGLYIDALLFSYQFANTRNDGEVRDNYKQTLEDYGSEYLYNLLKKADPKTAEQLHINDTKRIIRALEINISGIKKSEMPKNSQSKYDYAMIVLDLPREQLYERINERVHKMILGGMLDELKQLLKENTVNRNCQSMQAIGYKELLPFFEDTSTLSECIETLKQNTRNYAKRQITYFKGFKNAIWLNPLTQKQEIFKLLEEKLNNEN